MPAPFPLGKPPRPIWQPCGDLWLIRLAMSIEDDDWRQVVEKESVPVYQQRSSTSKAELINGTTCVCYMQVVWRMCCLNHAMHAAFMPLKTTIVDTMEDLVVNYSRHTSESEKELVSFATVALLWPACPWARKAHVYAGVAKELRAMVAPTRAPRVARLEDLHDDYLRNCDGLLPSQLLHKKHGDMDKSDRALFAAVKRYIYSLLFKRGGPGSALWSKPKPPYFQDLFIGGLQ